MRFEYIHLLWWRIPCGTPFYSIYFYHFPYISGLPCIIGPDFKHRDHFSWYILRIHTGVEFLVYALHCNRRSHRHSKTGQRPVEAVLSTSLILPLPHLLCILHWISWGCVCGVLLLSFPTVSAQISMYIFYFLLDFENSFEKCMSLSRTLPYRGESTWNCPSTTQINIRQALTSTIHGWHSIYQLSYLAVMDKIRTSHFSWDDT